MEKCSGLCLTTPDEQKEIKRIVDEYLARTRTFTTTNTLNTSCAGWHLTMPDFYQGGKF
ncbi:MAG: hypothetical protein V8R83_08320 [Candidatus Gastranaerophilaceae bacterium]